MITNQLARLTVLKRELSKYENLTYGFADHEMADSNFSEILPAMSIGFGASVIEKHFTLSRNLELEDSESALNSDEFLAFATNLKTLYSAIGSEVNNLDFGMSEEESTYRTNIRRHVLVKHDMPAGALLTDDDVLLKRSASNDPIYTIEEVIGKKLIRAIGAENPLETKHITHG